MAVGVWGCGSNHVDIFFMRMASGIPRFRRMEMQAERDALLRRLDELDEGAEELARRRREVLAGLGTLRDRLYPRLEKVHGRRPPVHDRPPLPPAAPMATPLRGRALRRTALGVLARRGPMELPDLHAALHLAGYRVAGKHPVKALADAMRYEVGAGHARRVRRGTYGLAPGWRPPARWRPRDPRPAIDPVVFWDREEWPGDGEGLDGAVGVDGPRLVAERRGAAAGPQGDDLSADRDGRLLWGAGTDVEADRRHDPRQVGFGDAGFEQALDSLGVRAPAAHGPDVADPGGEGADEGGDVELGVVGQDAHCVAWPEFGPDLGQVAVGPVDDDLVGEREALAGGEDGAGVADGDVVAEELGDPEEGGGEVDGAEDDHLRWWCERLDEDGQVLLAGLAVEPVVAGAAAAGLQLADAVAGDDAVEGLVPEAATDLPVGEGEELGAEALGGAGDDGRQRDRAGRPDGVAQGLVEGGGLGAHQSSGSMKTWMVPPHDSPTANASSSEYPNDTRRGPPD